MFQFVRFRFQLKRILYGGLIMLQILAIIYILKTTRVKPSGTPPPTTTTRTSTEVRQTSNVIAVLVLVCDRLTITRTLDQLFMHRPSPERFPIIVSQDCDKRGSGVKERVMQKYGGNVTYIMHPNYEETQRNVDKLQIPDHMRGYYHISVHYGWALNYTFRTLDFQNVIIVEDDLDISPDFFEYFESTLPLLHSDPTLWCVSAYNDNGRRELIDTNAPELLYRTDFFPGLGWMMIKDLWEELMPKWPNKFWDDWMRDRNQRKGRACIHPEISRTKTYGVNGVSNGQFFDTYLATIELNKKFVPFKSMDLSYLLKSTYDTEFMTRVGAATPARTIAGLKASIATLNSSKKGNFQLTYRSENEFRMYAQVLGIMDDFKDDVARGGYKGIVPTMFRGSRVYLVPSK